MQSTQTRAIGHEKLSQHSAVEVRQYIRAGRYNGHTAGLAPGHLQGNLVILNAEHALDFFSFCQRNPKSCPLVGISDIGKPEMFTLGDDIDIRTDVPAYYLYRDGELAETIKDIKHLWRDDSVAFVIGCSFTFEHALQTAGIHLWHIDNNQTVPMFTSNIPTVPAGLFDGNMVVSMRAIEKSRVQEAIDISHRLPMAHGAPVHWGDPAAIGIKDISNPDWGDPAPLPDGTLPVFWACGVTPQVAIMQARPSICITHKPGSMLITDIKEDAETPMFKSNTPTRGD